MDNNNSNYINLDDEKLSKETIEENKLKNYLNGIFSGTRNVVNNHLFGKIVSSFLFVLIVFTIIIIPRASYDFKRISFERKNILGNLFRNNAIANENSNQQSNEIKKNTTNSNFSSNNNLVIKNDLNPFNNIYQNSQNNLIQTDNESENNFKLPPIDLSWIFQGDERDSGKPLSENGSLDLSAEDKIPKLSSALDSNEEINQNSREMVGKVVVKTSSIERVLSDKFDVGQTIKLVYNEKEYVLKVEGKTLLDKETLIVVNRQIGEKIFNTEQSSTIENVKIII